jgi:prophage DNA circulation protein
MSKSNNPFTTQSNQALHTNPKTDNTVQSNISGAAKTTTSTLGNTAAGITNTAGGIIGAATRGLGETFNSATGQNMKPVGDAATNLGAGVEGAGKETAEGMKRAGEWKGPS